MKKRIVVALGHKALGTTLPEQKSAVKRSAEVLADIVEEGYQLAVCHSNAPQVGMIHTAMNEFGKKHPDYTEAPMSVCSAMSQGYIGYDLQNALQTALLKRGIYKGACTVLTQVTVDPYDEAFYKPSKIIGRVMTEEEAEEEEKKGNHVVRTEEGYRRIVAAPMPHQIVELDAVNTLMDADQVVIAAGGGGIPVLEQGTVLKGASAVIEKDLIAGLLADGVEADMLIILTAVEKVAINFGKENEQWLDRLSLSDAERFIEEGHFAKGSMLPKVEAAASFDRSRAGREALITVLSKAKEGIEGKTGTFISK